MIPFRRLKISDRSQVHPVFYSDGKQNSEYSFNNLFLWGRQEVAEVCGCICGFCHWGGRSMYLFPQGQGDQLQALRCLIDDAKQRGIPLRLCGLSLDEVAFLEEFFPGRFRVSSARDTFDYVYDITRLASLSGRKLSQKRNHIHRFEENYPDWRVERIAKENLLQCREMVAQWYVRHDALYGEGDFAMEQDAVRLCFEHFFDLQMEGLLLRVNGEIVAVTMGSRTSEDTFDVNFEKAYSDMQGAYPLINRSFARYLHEKYPELLWLNREDDMGIPGLRKAKESYHPDRLTEKFNALLLEDENGLSASGSC